MARNHQQDFVIQIDKLRAKYRIDSFNRIAALCKAIGVKTNCKIEIRTKPSGDVQFDVIGYQNGIKNAWKSMQDNFCKPTALSKNPQSSGKVWKLIRKKEQWKFYEEGLPINPGQPLLTEAALRQHDLQNEIFELREFACGDCQQMWWKSVLITKRVSTCSSCGIRYDALPREKEFGIGRYICRNNHTFYKFCHATQEFICRECRELVYQPYIHPDLVNERPRKYTGARKPYNPDSPLYIFNPSTRHVSTGSTVFTFLTQAEGAGSDNSDTLPSCSDSSSDDDDDAKTTTPHLSDDDQEMLKSSNLVLDSESEAEEPIRKRALNASTDSEEDDDKTSTTSTVSPHSSDVDKNGTTII